MKKIGIYKSIIVSFFLKMSVIGIAAQHKNREFDAAKFSNFFVMSEGVTRNPTIGVILRRTDGRVFGMRHDRAMTACPIGSRIPTIRELAMYGQSLGAMGILEVDQVDPSSIPQGYYLVSAINTDNKTDEFYYNHEGFKYPNGDFYGAYYFWSSSLVSSDSGSAYDFAFDGFIGDRLRFSVDAVLCVTNL